MNQNQQQQLMNQISGYKEAIQVYDSELGNLQNYNKQLQTENNEIMSNYKQMQHQLNIYNSFLDEMISQGMIERDDFMRFLNCYESQNPNHHLSVNPLDVTPTNPSCYNSNSTTPRVLSYHDNNNQNQNQNQENESFGNNYPSTGPMESHFRVNFNEQYRKSPYKKENENSNNYNQVNINSIDNFGNNDFYNNQNHTNAFSGNNFSNQNNFKQVSHLSEQMSSSTLYEKNIQNPRDFANRCEVSGIGGKNYWQV